MIISEHNDVSGEHSFKTCLLTVLIQNESIKARSFGRILSQRLRAAGLAGGPGGGFPGGAGGGGGEGPSLGRMVGGLGSVILLGGGVILVNSALYNGKILMDSSF